MCVLCVSMCACEAIFEMTCLDVMKGKKFERKESDVEGSSLLPHQFTSHRGYLESICTSMLFSFHFSLSTADFALSAKKKCYLLVCFPSISFLCTFAGS